MTGTILPIEGVLFYFLVLSFVGNKVACWLGDIIGEWVKSYLAN